MATDASATPSPTPNRPRPLLLVLLGLTVLVAVWMNFGGAGDSAPPTAAVRQARARDTQAGQKLDPAELDIRLEALAGERPAPGGTERDPFRFKPKPPPPPPPVSRLPAGAETNVPTGPPQAAAPPPITVKFIGTLELPDGAMVAIFTDCTVGRRSMPVRESGTIMGQYRLVKIGLQSVVVEHLDGRGRTTLPKTGQECVK